MKASKAKEEVPKDGIPKEPLAAMKAAKVGSKKRKGAGKTAAMKAARVTAKNTKGKGKGRGRTVSKKPAGCGGGQKKTAAPTTPPGNGSQKEEAPVEAKDEQDDDEEVLRDVYKARKFKKMFAYLEENVRKAWDDASKLTGGQARDEQTRIINAYYQTKTDGKGFRANPKAAIFTEEKQHKKTKHFNDDKKGRLEGLVNF
jgi:hypothetical protein